MFAGGLIFQNSTATTATPYPTEEPSSQPTAGVDVAASEAFDDIDEQFRNTLKSSIAFNRPTEMEQDETAAIELVLNPSMSEAALATQIAQQQAEAGLAVETGEIEITPRMRARLFSQDENAFTIREMHEDAEQPISLVDTTRWRWAVTARKAGRQTLELIIYRLIKYDGKEFWREVETYKANIEVEVTISSWFQSLDWKWLAGAILIPLALATWGWLLISRKKSGKNSQEDSDEDGNTIHVHVGGDVHGNLVIGDENEADMDRRSEG